MLPAAHCLNVRHNICVDLLTIGFHQMARGHLVVQLGALRMLSRKLCVLVIEDYTLLLLEVPIEVMSFAASCGSKNYLRSFVSA